MIHFISKTWPFARQLVLFFLLCMGLFLPLKGWAQAVYMTTKTGVLLDFSFHYGRAIATGNPNTQNFKNNTTVNDVKLGYITDENWYIGGLYSVKNYSSTDGSSDGKASGAGIGYFFRNNLNFRAFYRFNEAYGQYQEGSGYQADLEYKISFTSYFNVGVLISHRQVTFKKNDSILNFEDYTFNETYPAISLGFLIN